MAERDEAQKVIDRLNAEHPGDALFTLTRWEQSYYSATAPFQQQIASPGDHDIVVFIFWKRLGTDLPPAYNRSDGSTRTGTEYEFEEARDAREKRVEQLPDILVYRKTANVLFSEETVDVERAQKKALDQFWERWFRTSAGHFIAGFQSFLDPQAFALQFERNLRDWLARQRARRIVWDVERQGSPYRGLAAFDEEHSRLFFGRDIDIGRARALFIEAAVGHESGRRGSPFLLILGASGSGKSSLLNAGLLPRLRAGGVPAFREDGSDGIRGFRSVVIVPRETGNDLCAGFASSLYASKPVGRADTALPELADGDFQTPAEFAALATKSPELGAASILRALDRIRPPAIAGQGTSASSDRWALLVAIDQMEELLSRDDIDRQSFTRLLTVLVATGRVWVVATMRNDFYDRLRLDPELSALCDRGRIYNLAPPGAGDYGAIIRQPAAAAGLVFETTASRDLSAEIEEEAASRGALPMIAFLLEQLFQERRSNTLMFETYDRLGGAAGALSNHGEQVIATLEPAVCNAFPRVVRRLVRKGLTDIGATATAAPLATFAPGGPERALIDALGSARLVQTFSVTAGSPPVAVTWVRWTHEALLARWPRLRTLIDEDRRDYETLDRLTSAHSLWENTTPEQRNARLLIDLALGEGADLVNRWGEDVGEPIRRFVGLSLARQRLHRRRRRRVLSGIVATLSILTIVASGAAIIAARARNSALLAEQKAEREARTAKEVTDFMVGLFKDVDPGQARGKTLLAREVMDHGLAKIRAELKDQPAVRSQVLRAIGTVYNSLGLYGEGEAVMRECLSLAERTPSIGPLERARAQEALAYAIVDAGKLTEAEDLYLKAIAYYDSAPEHRIDATTARGRLGYAYWYDGKYQLAYDVLSMGRVAALELTGPSSDLTAGILFDLGRAVGSLGDREQGLKYMVDANNLVRKLHGDDYYWYASGLYSIGFQLSILHRLPEAADHFSRSISILERVLGPDHPWLAVALYGYGRVLLDQGKYAESIRALTRSIAISEHAGGTFSNETDQARIELAKVYSAIGEYALALPALKSATDDVLAHAGASSIYYQSTLQVYGSTLRRAGQTAEAVIVLRKSLELLEHIAPGNSSRMRSGLGALADAMCTPGPSSEGFALAERAIALKVEGGVPWETAQYAGIGAYCDPDHEHVSDNERALHSALAVVKDARGASAPQTRDMVFRLIRFYRAAGRASPAEELEHLLRTEFALPTVAP